MCALSDDDPFAVIDFVLNNLSCPAGKGFQALLEIFILPAHFDGLPAFDGTDAGEGKTAFELPP